MLELARAIGYELSPGVAAGTDLAFTLETAPGAPESVTVVGTGIKVQSVPGPGRAAADLRDGRGDRGARRSGTRCRRD